VKPTLISTLAESLSRATSGGLFPITAYGVNEDTLSILTTNIKDLPYALEILKIATGRDYNLGYSFPRANLERAAKENPHVYRIHDFTIAGIAAETPQDVGKVVRMFGAPFYAQKAFGLVDIVGFSRMNHPDQLSHLYSLNNILNSSINRTYKFCQRLGVPKEFGWSSTGDGFYFWHDAIGGNADVAAFMLLVCMMTQSEAMRANGFSLRLRGVYVIDSAFMIYTPRPVMSLDIPATTGVGAATNGAARLSAAAKPSQILLGDFTRAGQPGETMDPRTLLAQCNELFREEKSGAATLALNPDRKLRVTDKHGVHWYCFNVSGEVPNIGAGRVTRQNVGLNTEDAQDIESLRFLSEP
jgi:hypothetical protein